VGFRGKWCTTKLNDMQRTQFVRQMVGVRGEWGPSEVEWWALEASGGFSGWWVVGDGRGKWFAMG